MLREIRVYGQLAKFLGRRKFMAAVDSAAEAIRFLLANYPQVERHMCQDGRHYRVMVGDHAAGMEELHGPAGSNAIKIIPVIGGAGGGVGQILAGVALVAAAIFIPGLGLGLAGATVTKIGLLGGALILGGISQALTPTPTLASSGTYSGSQGTTNTEMDPQKSYSFSGIQNTSRAGVPLPLAFGEVICGSVVISAGIDTVQIEA
jgi:predicted phage tail protein